MKRDRDDNDDDFSTLVLNQSGLFPMDTDPDDYDPFDDCYLPLKKQHVDHSLDHSYGSSADPMDTTPDLDLDLNDGLEFWDSLIVDKDVDQLFSMVDAMNESLTSFDTNDHSFWDQTDDIIVPPMIDFTTLCQKLQSCIDFHNNNGRIVTAIDVLNVTRGRPKDNFNLLVDCVSNSLRECGNQFFILVIKGTDMSTIKLIFDNYLLKSNSVIFNVSPVDNIGNVISSDDILEFKSEYLRWCRIDPSDDAVTHASVGFDDYVLLWMRHYFDIHIISNDRYHDENVLAAMFRGIRFSIETVDGRTGTCAVYSTILEPL